jgi:hypothetical protein
MSGWIALALMIGVICAEPEHGANSNPVLIDSTRPSVYVTFVKKEASMSKYGGKEHERLWLRVHNNTRWAIWTIALPDEFGGEGWFYTLVSDSPGRDLIAPRQGYFGDVVAITGLEPGRTCVISVPPEHLREGVAIMLDFGFSWEHGVSGATGLAVRHSVYFGHTDLPVEVRKILPPGADTNPSRHPPVQP